LEILIRQITAVTESEASRRLAAIPGLGIITATAIAATVTDAGQFSSGRQFAAWLGLTPQQHSTGGKTRLGGISKQGDRYLRRLLVVGATAVMRHVKDKPTPMADWIRKLSEKALPARLGGPCQQPRPDRLGRADPQGGLSPLRPFDLITPGHPKW